MSSRKSAIGFEDRAVRLAQERNIKMARSPHAYVRGSTAKFYEWLLASGGRVPEGPPVWICGDCHIGNLGPLADTDGHVAVQIRDLDQTVVGNPAHDLIRLGLSLASAARGSGLPGVTTAHILENLVSGYEAGLAGDTEANQDKVYRPRRIRRLLQASVKRRWRHLAQERLDSVQPKLPLGRKFWALSTDEREALEALFGDDQRALLIDQLPGWAEAGPVQMIDAAYWMKGCSSLGRLRYAVMLRVGEGPKSSLRLIDIKEAITPSAPRLEGGRMPRDNAERVVEGTRALSPNLGERIVASRFLKRPVVLRELMPQDLKIQVERLTQADAAAIAAYLANVVGRAHARQMDAATRQQWLSELGRYRSIELDAPSWLWSSVVDLLSVHEAAYLDHCRRFALAQAA